MADLVVKTTDPPLAVVSRIPGRHLDLFICGEDGQVYTAWWHEGKRWSTFSRGWKCLGGKAFPPGAPVAAISRDSDHLQLFVCGNDGQVFTTDWSQTSDWRDPHDWQSLRGEGLFWPGTRIAVVSRRGGTSLFASSRDGNVFGCWYCRLCDSWSSLSGCRCLKSGYWKSGWRNLGGIYHRKTACTNVAALTRDGETLDIFFCGDDGQVRHKHWKWKGSVDGWDKHWEVIGGHQLLPGGYIAAVSRSSDHIDLFATGVDGSVYTSWWREGSTWSGTRGEWQNLGGDFLPGTSLSAMAPGPEQLELGAVDRFGFVRCTGWRRGQRWGHWITEGEHTHSVPGGRFVGLSPSLATVNLFLVSQDNNVLVNRGKDIDGWMRYDGWESIGAVPGV